MMLTGLGVAVIIYMLVAVAVVAVLHARRAGNHQRVRGPGAPGGCQQGSAGLPDRQGVPVPGGVRGGQHCADQHDDGQPVALRPGQAGRAAAHPGQRLTEEPGTVGRHPVLDRPRLGPDHVRRHRVRQPRRRASCPAPRRCCCSVSSPLSTSPAWFCAGTRATGYFRSPGPTPLLAAVRPRGTHRHPVGRARAPPVQDRGGLLGVGVVLWAITWLINRGVTRAEDRVPRHRPHG